MEHQSENKTCQNCKNDFTIEPDDFSFYEKIKVPAPTFCPLCRFQRRMAWRNDWHLFHKTDALTGEKIFSLYPEESPVKIYEKSYWNSDEWNPLDYGRDFDFSRPFFEQFKELLNEVPLPSMALMNVVNSNYCNNANDIKNCYFVRGASFTEDSAYLIWDQGSKQCLDSHMTRNCELGYGNVNTIECYKTFFSVDCDNSFEMILCKDSIGCNNCFGSIGLRNKSYHIFNEPYSKEEYEKKIKEFNLGAYESFQSLKEKAYDLWDRFPHKYMHGYQNTSVSGDYIYKSKNAKNCYRVLETEDSKYVQNMLTGPIKDCYDYSNYGDNASLIYECIVMGSGISNCKFSLEGYPNVSFAEYSFHCNNVSNIFGCISLRNKKYCILNKQYSKEEYEDLVSKIITHMRKTGEYGEFFPTSLSPFPYQITAAYEFFPLNESEVKDKGFVSYDFIKQDYKVTLNNENIPDNIKETNKEIIKEIFECEHKKNCEQECTGAFRIIEKEFEFCKRMDLPLPRLCPNCRHYERLNKRNPLKLYYHKCMREGCNNEFETSYAPERPEIVYCEKCYQQEVY